MVTISIVKVLEDAFDRKFSSPIVASSLLRLALQIPTARCQTGPTHILLDVKLLALPCESKTACKGAVSTPDTAGRRQESLDR